MWSAASSLSRRRFIRLAAASAAAAAAAGLYTWRIEPHWLEIVRRRLPLRHLPTALLGRTLVQLSDIHVGQRVDDNYVTATFRRVAALDSRYRRPDRRYRKLSSRPAAAAQDASTSISRRAGWRLSRSSAIMITVPTGRTRRLPTPSSQRSSRLGLPFSATRCTRSAAFRSSGSTICGPTDSGLSAGWHGSIARGPLSS